MSKQGPTSLSKGSRTWPISYAFSALRENALRSIGLIVILGLGVSLVPGVMNWTATGIHIEVSEFIDETVYQVGMKPIDYEEAGGYDSLLAAEEVYQSHPWVRRVDRMISSICIVDGPLQATDDYPFNQDLYYVQGFKDARVILADAEELQRWKPIFTWRGDLRVGTNETVVSKTFIDYLEIASGRRVQIGDSIDIDIVLGAHGRYPNMRGNRRHSVFNLTIVGVYDLTSGTSVFTNAFTSLSRKLVDPFAMPQPVLGVMDSMIINIDDIPDDVIEEMTTRSFFSVASLIQASPEGLLAEGEANIPEKLMSLLDMIGEPQGLVSWGVREASNLETHINTYLQSRLIVVLALPVLFISLIIMVNAAETSVLKRKGEASLLRTKGASFNQILTSYLWESVIIFLSALTLGLILSVLFGILTGATQGVLLFNYQEFMLFWKMLVVHPLGMVIAAIVGLSLPITYMMQIGRLIDVEELQLLPPDISVEVEKRAQIGRLGLLILIITSSIIVMPYIIAPAGLVGVGEVLVLTILLYVSAFFGARFARQFLASITAKLSFILGEKSIYLARSLSKRRGRLIPLLVILTLILSSTTMMIVELEGFNRNLNLEMDYAIGADLRIEIENASLELQNSFRQVRGIIETMPVLEVQAQIGDNQFYLEGVNPEQYSRIGHFRTDSFSSNTSDGILRTLNEVPNGLILSDYYGRLWNKTVGDNLTIVYYRPEISLAEFTIIGFVKSAPGFGVASTDELEYGSVASGFGFQIGRGGFALVNFDFIQPRMNVTTVNLFLGSILAGTNLPTLANTLIANFDASVYAPGYSNPRDISRSVSLYLSGFESLVSISIVLLSIMGVFAIITLLTAAVGERFQEYAILRAVGAKEKQIVSLVFQEFASVVVAALAISLVIGTAMGIAFSVLAFGISPMWSTLINPPYIPFNALLLLSIIELIILTIACIIPAKQALVEDPSRTLRNL
ncbi:MAG: FtsX-like permease family protein [Candidatus Thorarchaeota archaeon]